MKKNSFFTLIFLLCFSANLSSQKEAKTLKIGLNLGAYLPAKSYATFLDGSHPNGVNRILNDPIIRPQLEQKLRYSIVNWAYPTKMRYNVSLFMGGYFGLQLSDDVSFIANMNLTRVKLEQVLLVRLNNPQNIQGEFEQAVISANERRFDIQLGVESVFSEAGPLRFYIAGGGLVNYNQLEKHELRIANTNYSIMRVNLTGGRNQVVKGFGYGFFTHIGTRFNFSEQFTIDLGVELNATQNRAYVNSLVENTGYSNELAEQAKKFKLNGNAYFRIIWN